MRTLLSYFPLLISLPSLALAVESPNLEQLSAQEISRLVEIYKHLHSNPELSYNERETSELLARELRSLGYTVTEGVGNYGIEGRESYGLVGVLENGQGPTVLVRTDTDALPVEEKTGLPYESKVRVRIDEGVESGVMHACGHDIHMSSFLGTAWMLAQLKDSWKGTLVMIGEPAEERGAGAKALLDDGLYERFPKPDYALALHVHEALEAGKIGYCPGYALASVDSVDITIRGAGGHGAYPHLTIDPVVLTAQIILGLQTITSRIISPLDPAVVTVGSIHGGTKHNIIPDEVNLQLTVRSYKAEVRDKVLDSIRRITAGIARASGVPEDRMPVVGISEEEYTPSTFNDPDLTASLTRVFKRELGEGSVVRIDPVMAGEDFSRYRLNDSSVPSLIFWLGTLDPAKSAELKSQGKSPPGLHSSEFAPLPEPSIRTGMRAMASAVLSLFEN